MKILRIVVWLALGIAIHHWGPQLVWRTLAAYWDKDPGTP